MKKPSTLSPVTQNTAGPADLSDEAFVSRCLRLQKTRAGVAELVNDPVGTSQTAAVPEGMSLERSNVFPGRAARCCRMQPDVRLQNERGRGNENQVPRPDDGVLLAL